MMGIKAYVNNIYVELYCNLVTDKLDQTVKHNYIILCNIKSTNYKLNYINVCMF